MTEEKENFSYEPAAEALSTAVFVTDRSGIIRYSNAAGELLAGISRPKLLGLDVRMFFSEAELWLRHFSEERDSAQPLTCVTDASSPASPGKIRKVRVTVSGYQRGKGTVLFEVSDCGEAWLAENEAQQAGLSETSRQVLRNLAHEIKNPLGGIRGAAQLLEGELDSPDLREYTGVIIGEADRLQNLVDRLLAPYRSRQCVSEVNIHEILERVRQLLSAEFPNGLEFLRDYDVSIPSFRADRGQLQQVFLNIVRNAAEALAPKILEGTAKIRLVTRIAQQVTLGRNRCRMALSVRVIDNGPGIPEEIRERIFYPLVTGKPNGSGLGLSLAQNFIQRQGGTISVTSEPGRTEFSVLLPLVVPQPGAADKKN